LGAAEEANRVVETSRNKPLDEPVEERLSVWAALEEGPAVGGVALDVSESDVAADETEGTSAGTDIIAFFALSCFFL
jgi:hypothetical protein